MKEVNDEERKVFLDVLDNTLEPITSAGKIPTPHVLLYKDQRMKVPSGKMVWNSRAAASSALGNAIRSIVEINLRVKFSNYGCHTAGNAYDRIRKDLLNKGIIKIVPA
jgi:hypothetical protein